MHFKVKGGSIPIHILQSRSVIVLSAYYMAVVRNIEFCSLFANALQEAELIKQGIALVMFSPTPNLISSAPALFVYLIYMVQFPKGFLTRNYFHLQMMISLEGFLTECCTLNRGKQNFHAISITNIQWQLIVYILGHSANFTISLKIKPNMTIANREALSSDNLSFNIAVANI